MYLIISLVMLTISICIFCFSLNQKITSLITNNEITIQSKVFQRIENILPDTILQLQPSIHGEIVFKNSVGAKENPIVIKNTSTEDAVVGPKHYRVFL